MKRYWSEICAALFLAAVISCFGGVIVHASSAENQITDQLELADLDVNMFSAVNNSLINDGCGLFRGRLILPYEHLSRFQSD